MPKIKLHEPISLQWICIKNVAAHMDDVWCSHFKETLSNEKLMYVIGPFHNVDGNSLTRIMQMIMPKKRITKVHLNLLITSHLTEVDFSYCNWVNNATMDLILMRCDHVKTLILCGCATIKSALLFKLVEKYGDSLRKLNLRKTSCRDHVLEAIGRCCKTLVYLDISECHKVTIYGLEALFIKPDSKNKTTQLAKTVLSLCMEMCYYGDNQESFVAQLLLHWSPKLVELRADELWPGIAKVCQLNNGPKPLKLCGPNRDSSPIDLLKLKNLVDLKVFAACLPFLNHINISSHTGLIGVELCDILMEFGPRLKSIILTCSMPFEYILYIGTVCPNIEHLTIELTSVNNLSSHIGLRDAFERNISDFHSDKECQTKPWKKLNHLFIHIDAQNFNTSVFKAIVVNAQNSLKMLKLCCCHEHSTSFSYLFRWIVQCNELKKLKVLDVADLSVDLESIWQCVTSPSELELISFRNSYSLTRKEFGQLSKYILENNINLKFQHDQCYLESLNDIFIN